MSTSNHPRLRHGHDLLYASPKNGFLLWWGNNRKKTDPISGRSEESRVPSTAGQYKHNSNHCTENTKGTQAPPWVKTESHNTYLNKNCFTRSLCWKFVNFVIFGQLLQCCCRAKKKGMHCILFEQAFIICVLFFVIRGSCIAVLVKTAKKGPACNEFSLGGYNLRLQPGGKPGQRNSNRGLT